jgi:MurNAc alpha-1-phosphate uridylyltransferase
MSTAGLNTAMILAAGFGTRLKPLTDTTPKALIPHKGKPMIENVLNKLIGGGITKFVINTHYLSEQLTEYFDAKSFPAEIKLVHENEILGTGGGIKNAAGYLKDSDDFLVYNVDVDCGINIKDMYRHHRANSNFVTLAVKKRDSERPLLFDDKMNLIGNKTKDGEFNYTDYSGAVSYYGFTGIHIISAKIFVDFTEEGFFDIFRPYFRHVKGYSARINGYDIGNTDWKDLGSISKLE